MTFTADPVILVDLDGTLIDVNSFPIWVLAILTGRVEGVGAGARLRASIGCALALTARKVLRQPHAPFKRRIQRLWSRLTQGAPTGRAAEALATRLAGHVRPNLLLLVRDIAAGRLAGALTTAAAAEYALPLARQLGFREVVATPAGGGSDAIDNVGTVKRDRTLERLRTLGWGSRPRTLLTDSFDDLPLMGVCTRVLWFGSDADFAQLSTRLPGVRAVDARELNANELDAAVRGASELASLQH